jgi:hypothetical protein
VDRIWQGHWPPGVDEAHIRLPDDSLPARLKATAARMPRKAALVF